ncbi:MAG: flagellar hook-basal body complex protein FliE [Opitutaceae bacterium]
MSLIGSISTAFPTVPLDQPSQLGVPKLPASTQTDATQPASGFGSMLEGLVSMVDQKQTQSDTVANSVMLGDSSQLHQSVIAMQEASVALSLMVQVRNKLVDAYQELMRMQV